MHGGRALGKKQTAGRGGWQAKVFLSAVARHERAFRPGIWVRAGKPMMAVHADLGIGIEVVAERPARGELVMVRRHVDASSAEPGLKRFAIYHGASHAAESG